MSNITGSTHTNTHKEYFEAMFYTVSSFFQDILDGNHSELLSDVHHLVELGLNLSTATLVCIEIFILLQLFFFLFSTLPDDLTIGVLLHFYRL